MRNIFYNNRTKKLQISQVRISKVAKLTTFFNLCIFAPAFANSDSNINELSSSIIESNVNLNYENTQKNRTVTGRVVDSQGEPIIGANILVLGTDRGTISDFDGNFSVDVNANSTIKVSFIGYKDKTIKVGNNVNLAVTLEEDTEVIDEVVVMGYGTMKKRDVVGSVATVKAEDLVKTSVMDVSRALQGKAAGLNVTQTAGGIKVEIRGVRTINSSNDPIWVVDGVVSDGQVNPQDIESIEVLKDASATAIYGSRGSNGVILVTTKKGEKNKTSINVSYQGSIRKQIKNYEDYGYANVNEWYAIINKATTNSGVPEFVPSDFLNEFAVDYAYTDLTKEQSMQSDAGKLIDYLTRTGFTNQINFSVSSGNDKGNIYLSGTYHNDKSLLVGNHGDTFYFRLNGDYKLLPYLTVGTRNYVKLGKSSGTNAGNQQRLVWMPLTYEDDPYNTGFWNSFQGHPVASAMEKYARSDNESISAQLGGYAELDLGFITDGLAFRTELNYSRYSNGNSSWKSALINNPPARATAGSTASESNSIGTKLHYNFFLKYDKTFGKHYFNFVGGTESERSIGYYRAAAGRLTEGSYPQLGGNPGEKNLAQGYQSYEDYMRSYFGRFNYKFNDRYIAGVSVRRDGASNFAPKHRWSTFTAYSLGWIISEENFLNDIEWIELLKLRGSIGETGNKGVPNKFFTTWENNGSWLYGEYQYAQIGGTRPMNIGNENLTWETTKSYDFGIDFGLWNNRLNGSIAYYMQDVDGLVLAAQIPSSTGLGGVQEIWGNMGRVQNYGIELSLSSVNISKKDFQWTTNFNITTNKNIVKALTPELDKNNLPLYENNVVSKTGHGIREFYMAEYAGVDPDKGVEMIYEIDYEHWQKTGDIVKTGRLIPATDDNVSRNKINLGKSFLPKFFGGLDNTFTYKDFDLNFMLTFSGGNYIYDNNRASISCINRGGNNFDKAILTESWEKPGDKANYPMIVYNRQFPWDWDPNVENPNSPTGKGDWVQRTGSGSSSHSKYLERADMLRLKHIELGYTLPRNITKKAGLNSVRFFVSGDDLFTLTPYKGWDPQSGNLSKGVVSEGFVVYASYNFGIQVKL